MRALFFGTEGIEVLPPLDLPEQVIDRQWMTIERPFLPPDDVFPQTDPEGFEFLSMRFRFESIIGPEDGGPAAIYRVC